MTLLTHSIAGAFGWKLLEKYGDDISRVVAIAPAPPGNIQAAAKVVEEGDGYVAVLQSAGPFRVDLCFSPPPDRG